MKSPRSIIYGFAILAVLGVFALVLHLSDWPGGMEPVYRARDHDPQLERDAARAKPVIDALEKFHLKNAAYPATAADVLPLLAATPAPGAPAGTVNGWRYSRSADGKGYELALKLGENPSLLYEFDGTRRMWVYSPGGGAGSKEIVLGK